MRGREGAFIDKRLGERAKNMTEDEKMKMRFMREARDRTGTKVSRGKIKFMLEDDEDAEGEDHFLTHKGKRIQDLDDFQDDISISDEDDNKEAAKGILGDDIVNHLNFGVGNEDEEEGFVKKTREEREHEIREKSKAYKLHAQEIRAANKDVIEELDEDYKEFAQTLNYKGREQKKRELPESGRQARDEFDDIMA
jgi:nucleolar protein 14